MTGIEQWLLKGKMPWTLHHSKPDHACLQPAAECARIDYPKPDGKITFDRLSSVFLSNSNHEEAQPVHLTLKHASVPIEVTLALYDPPEQRYCPAGVYEIVGTETVDPRLHTTAQRSEAHTTQLLSLMRLSFCVFAI